MESSLEYFKDHTIDFNGLEQEELEFFCFLLESMGWSIINKTSKQQRHLVFHSDSIATFIDRAFVFRDTRQLQDIIDQWSLYKKEMEPIFVKINNLNEFIDAQTVLFNAGFHWGGGQGTRHMSEIGLLNHDQPIYPFIITSVGQEGLIHYCYNKYIIDSFATSTINKLLLRLQHDKMIKEINENN